MNTIEVVSRKISLELVADCLASAFEGGCDYWCYTDKSKSKAPAVELEGYEEFYHLSYPLSVGGSLCVTISSDDAEERVDHMLTLGKVAKGLELWANTYPVEFAEFTREDYDATGADHLVQFALFGEIVYG